MENKQPNIVFVITDDQGYGDLSCHGNPVLQTPNIDAFHDQSIRFTDYHVGPTCAPTRAGLMTGHYHNSTGVWHTIGGRSLLREDEYSLASALRDAGYATGIFGKWHLGDSYPYRPHDRGFDESVVHGGGGIGNTPDYWNNDYFDDTYFDRGEPRPFTGYCTDVFFGLAKDFIRRNAQQDKPFFCFLPTNAPHGPWQVPPAYAEPYQEIYPEGIRSRFYGMIANIDENFGKLQDFLQELGIAENTILIFMTDNGTWGGCTIDDSGHVTEGFNAGMRGIKSWEYEGGHRTPFFIRWPGGGISGGKDISTLCANVDVMPTLLDLCGVAIPDGLDGRSLVPLLNASSPQTEQEFSQRILVTDSQRLPIPVKWRKSCVMQDKLRLINGKELYDISRDPSETCDLARWMPEKVEELRSAYNDWWEKVSVKFDEEIPLHVGNPGEETVKLNAHDLRGDSDDVAWNQGQVRQGRVIDSYWEIQVDREGEYEVELRRWPREAGLKLREGIPGELGTGADWWHGGRSIPICTANLTVAGQSFSRQVTEDDLFICFRMRLPSGASHLRAWFTDESGTVISAYYAYVTRVAC